MRLRLFVALLIVALLALAAVGVVRGLFPGRESTSRAGGAGPAASPGRRRDPR